MTQTATTDADPSPPLPRTLVDWLKVFGPGAVVASLTIGTGELIFSTRGGAIFGYRILFVFTLILLLKWALVLASARHMLLTGVHPYARMLDLPGPRGWLPILLLMIATVCLPIWISFHSGVIGNLMSWLTNTRDHFHGGMDYIWGAGVLLCVLALSATGGYEVMERVQMVIVAALVLCAGASLMLYKPDWLQMAAGLIPQPLSYPKWIETGHPDIAANSVWVETTRYVGVIGGAGFDYMAYTSWLREKRWGMLPRVASASELRAIAENPQHAVRRWVPAPFIDSTISFALVIGFSAVFIASGAIILGPNEQVPNEKNMLNLQASLVTRIHPWLLPLYVAGALFTMVGTLYGTIEIASSISDEIVRSFVTDWTEERKRRLKRVVVAWCAPIAFSILAWLFMRQARLGEHVTADAVEKPRMLLSILTPVNLFTGVLSCGLISFLNVWMDRRYLPRSLQLPTWLFGLNIFSGVVFLALGLRGYWEEKERTLVIGSATAAIPVSLLIANIVRRFTSNTASHSQQGPTP